MSHTGHYDAVRGAAACIVLCICAACSQGQEVERSASEFCGRYAEIAASLDVSEKGLAPVEQASSQQIDDLAERAPGNRLEEALEVIGRVQSDVIAFQEGLRSGEVSPEDVDAGQLREYAEAGRVVADERHSLCD